MDKNEDPILKSLADIVGEDYASNRPEELYLYSVDSGTEGPRPVDYVALPKTVEQVQMIVGLANERKIPITPMGANLTLNGLGLPVNGGIVLDMKRMDRIIELNRMARYVVIEAGVGQGRLASYIEKHSPDLEHPRPEAPPMATVVGNIMIRGHGQLSLRYGNNAHMINGMEVVLPTGEICQIGASSVSPWPFSKGPLPDLAGLFCGWHGTTGIVTKLTLKLFPKRQMLDVVGMVVTDLELLPDVLHRITHTDMVDNLFVVGFAPLGGDALPQFITISITGDMEEEMEYKRAVFRRVAEEAGSADGKIMFMKKVPDALRNRFVEKPLSVDPGMAADADKGGGFRYCGAILPVVQVPEAWRRGVEIAHKHEMGYRCGIQVLGYCHSAMFGFVYTFNRADEPSVERVREAMKDTNEMVFELGGIPWKSEVTTQTQIVQKMDPSTAQLMQRIKNVLDPNNIMNPGNWSA
ncbi:MAG: FAD-binding oxidoreductase [Deltaproteobacteria bacterium]|nr:FAD-binding oxidoreductase [Deltaproteobacteria bacterium]